MMSVPTDPNSLRQAPRFISVDPMPEHSDSGSGRSITESIVLSLERGSMSRPTAYKLYSDILP